MQRKGTQNVRERSRGKASNGQNRQFYRPTGKGKVPSHDGILANALQNAMAFGRRYSTTWLEAL